MAADNYSVINLKGSLMINSSILELSQLEANLFDTPEALHAKLAIIKEELAEGRYQINTVTIAKCLLEPSITAIKQEKLQDELASI
ncbi:MAG: flagellar biosynthesis anti-sigma factor FlgM [Legionellaceae bacterium]